MSNSDSLKGFKCTSCGECCRWGGSVLLIEKDITRLSGYLKISEQEFIDSHTRLAPNRQGLALLDQPDGRCEFLKDDRCEIYAVRPEQCRTFPHSWSVSSGCPELDRLRKKSKPD